MITTRKVIGSQSKFYREGLVVTVAGDGGVGAAGVARRPGITDPLWLDIGPVKWTKSPTAKTEEYLVASPGAYVAEDEIVLSRGLKLKGKLEKQSNLAYELTLQAKATAALIPDSPTAGGQYNPLSSSPVVKGWLHVQEYDQNNVLLNTVDYWVSLRAAGDTNNDDKAAETPIEATVLFSTLNSGTLT